MPFVLLCLLVQRKKNSKEMKEERKEEEREGVKGKEEGRKGEKEGRRERNLMARGSRKSFELESKLS